MKCIILSGGQGQRLWPLSTNAVPKQFAKLFGSSNSPFQESILRALLKVSENDIYLVMPAEQLRIALIQLSELEVLIPESHLLLEPRADKETLPAVYFAVQKIIAELDADSNLDDEFCLVFSSDHAIEQSEYLMDTLEKSQEFAISDILVFGIKPTAPETAFGYIKPGVQVDDSAENAFTVDKFVEKPDFETAEKYVSQGFLFNSGIFAFNARIFAEATKSHCPEVFAAFELPTADEKFQASPAISIDYGILERTKNLICIPLDVAWNDIGSIPSFFEVNKTSAIDSASSNEILGENFQELRQADSENNQIYSDTAKNIALLGVSDLVVIEYENQLLITKKDKLSKIREIHNNKNIRRL